MKSPLLLAFVVGVNALAIVGMALLAPRSVPDFWLGLSLLLTLAALGGAGPVRIPGLKTSISTADGFLFAGLGAFGPLPAGMIAVASVVGSVFGRKPDRNLLRFCFNIGNMVFSAAVAAAIYLAAGGVPGGPVASQVLPMFLGMVAYSFLNTVLVASAVSLASGRDFMRTWKEAARWAAVSASIGVTLAVALLWAIQVIGPSGLALGIFPCWMLASFYRTHKDRQERSQERIVQVEEMNTGLEEKVSERTRELQTALEDLERANTTLVETNERLTEANRAKSEFLANVSHELRTPLNAIIGFSDLLGDPNIGELNTQQREFVGDIHESGEHLLNLINDILDVTKIEAGKMEAKIELVQVERTIQEAASMLRPQATQKGLRLDAEVHPDIQRAELDPGMFRQLLVNLLSNAVKFTPAGGQVIVRGFREGADLVVAVEDTGVGMAQADLERIFDAFYQVDGSYSRQYEGTGLGLALVRRMVAMQGGTIDVASVVGRGSTFSCRFPGRLVDEGPAPDPLLARASAPQPVSAVTRQPGAQTILVVEDNPMNRKLARNALRSRGYHVLEATSGEEALDLVVGEAIDLVLMDIQLPGMDGLEVTRRLKADPYTAGLPIVAVTAHVKEIDEARALDAGCIGYITKPIRLAEFPGQVAGFLEGESAEFVTPS